MLAGALFNRWLLRKAVAEAGILLLACLIQLISSVAVFCLADTLLFLLPMMGITCAYAMAIPLLLGTALGAYGHCRGTAGAIFGLAYYVLIGLGLAFGARLHVMEKVGAGVGFSSITTIGIMFGQNMHPDSDLVFSDLYRITSVTFSLVATLTMVFLMHLILNRFEATRYVIATPKVD